MGNKRIRQPVSELEKAIKLGLKYDIHEIKTNEFTVTFKQPFVEVKGSTPANFGGHPTVKTKTDTPHKKPSLVSTINGEAVKHKASTSVLPNEPLMSDEDMLFWSTPTFQEDKPQMNGEAV